jgi:hypothetical protein
MQPGPGFIVLPGPGPDGVSTIRKTRCRPGGGGGHVPLAGSPYSSNTYEHVKMHPVSSFFDFFLLIIIIRISIFRSIKSALS